MWKSAVTVCVDKRPTETVKETELVPENPSTTEALLTWMNGAPRGRPAPFRDDDLGGGGIGGCQIGQTIASQVGQCQAGNCFVVGSSIVPPASCVGGEPSLASAQNHVDFLGRVAFVAVIVGIRARMLAAESHQVELAVAIDVPNHCGIGILSMFTDVDGTKVPSPWPFCRSSRLAPQHGIEVAVAVNVAQRQRRRSASRTRFERIADGAVPSPRARSNPGRS